MTASQPPDPAGPRVRVTSPRSTTPRPVNRSARQEIEEETAVGEVYMRSLIRSQLRAALAVVAIVLLSIGMAPVAFWLFDPVRNEAFLGIPLPWWILGAACYPGVVLLGWLYIRQAERAESDFSAVVEGDRL